MRRSTVALVLVLATIPWAATTAAGMDITYKGRAEYDDQPATMKLNINGTTVTGWLAKTGICSKNVRLTQTDLALTGTLTGVWEGSGTIIGNWTGGDKVCGTQLTPADGYPVSGTFTISLTDRTVRLLRTGAPPLPSGLGYDFGASGRTYDPSQDTAGGAGSGLPVEVELSCSESSGQPCTLLIQEFDASSGALQGWIQWPQLGSKHSITGTFDGRTLSFVEENAIVSGKAALGCRYTLEPSEDGYAGSYEDCRTGPPTGKFALTVETSIDEPDEASDEPAAVAAVLPTGVEFSCSESSGHPCTLLIQSLDVSSGALQGWIHWPQLGSKHSITGTFDGRTLSFVEESAIVKGRAALGCRYTLEPRESGFAGTYDGCASGSPDGSFQLAISAPS